jgi:hypothetical protein
MSRTISAKGVIAQSAVFDKQLVTRKTLHEQVPIYLRNAGDDTLDGSSVGNAVATLNRAFELLNTVDGGYSRQYIEATSYVDTLTDPGTGTGEYWDLPSSSRLAVNDINRAGAFDSGKQDFLNYPVEIYADPALVLTLDVASLSVDSDTGLTTINVNDTLVTNAHVGQMISGNIAEWGVIHSNTTSAIVVASGFLTTLTGVGIYEQSCVVTFTTAFGLTLTHRGPVAFNGIKFVGGIVRNYVHQYSYFQMCSFQGFYIDGTGGIAAAWACYFDGGNVNLEGAAAEFHDCVFHAASFSSHGSGGNGRNTLSYCILDGCNAYGSGNFESSFDIEVENCLIDNSTSHGIQKASPQRCRISDTKIQNCAGDAINATVGGGVCRVDTVSGTGNSGFGVQLSNGAQCQDIGVNTVGGTSGEVKVGGSSASLWSATVPRTDVGESAPEFCRIYT